MKRVVFAAALAAAACGSARGQSLFQQPVQIQLDANNQPDPAAEIRVASLLYVERPKPKTFQIHDQITIIIDERSSANSSQTLDTKKDYEISAALRRFPSIQAFLEAQIENGDSDSGAELDLSASNDFQGEGKYDRTDRFSARITAEIIDVKPNGVLVLEARKRIQKDEEIQEFILSGNARREDVTDSNTVLSTQLADLNLVSTNTGRVKEAATKGIIPRLLEAIFNF